ncbi:MAG: hydrogenase expression/formation protein HypE [Rhodospirillales bacterium]|nr:hydrogenase expression/formation protein HypE [Rhodospirillales bacterium]
MTKKPDCIELTHGSGGLATDRLISDLFMAAFDNPELARRNDGAVIDRVDGRIVVSTDGHVVTPLFFPGGDIGQLAVHGTVNDVAVMGAEPLSLTAGFIIEEGFEVALLEKIVRSMGAASRAAGVPVVAGDTKVVERGKADGVFITTTGIGWLKDGIDLSCEQARPGDAVLVSGTVGDHGLTILAAREGLDLGPELKSDSAALHAMTKRLTEAVPGLKVMRDATRGGLAAVLHEIAEASGVGMLITEAAVPVSDAVKGAGELLGLDPFHVANEGKLVAVCPAEQAEAALQALRADSRGSQAAIIGTVTDDADRFIEIETPFGGRRLLTRPEGDPLPRIC